MRIMKMDQGWTVPRAKGVKINREMRHPSMIFVYPLASFILFILLVLFFFEYFIYCVEDILGFFYEVVDVYGDKYSFLVMVSF